MDSVTRDCIIGTAVFLGMWLMAWLHRMMERPATCPKGHTDLYLFVNWRCRQCQAAKINRGVRRRMKERM